MSAPMLIDPDKVLIGLIGLSGLLAAVVLGVLFVLGVCR